LVEVVTKIGKKRVVVIPKRIADELGLKEGSKVLIRLEGDKIVIDPYVDPVWMALHGKKFAKITFEELEEESLEIQKKEVEGID